MSKELFARTQHLLEITQEKINRAEERLINCERQNQSLSERIMVLEQHVNLLRAHAIQEK